MIQYLHAMSYLNHHLRDYYHYRCPCNTYALSLTKGFPGRYFLQNHTVIYILCNFHLPKQKFRYVRPLICIMKLNYRVINKIVIGYFSKRNARRQLDSEKYSRRTRIFVNSNAPRNSRTLTCFIFVLKLFIDLQKKMAFNVFR